MVLAELDRAADGARREMLAIDVECDEALVSSRCTAPAERSRRAFWVAMIVGAADLQESVIVA